MTSHTTADATKVFIDPQAYTNEITLHAALTHLRANEPVALVEASGYQPFWAITKYDDIMSVERANDIFINKPRQVLSTAERDEEQRQIGVSTLIHMDEPEHRAFRAIGANWFRPKAMRALEDRANELARVHVDRMMNAGGECDFVQEVAVNYPLYMIMSLLGIPDSDFGMMLRLTQEMFGSDDAEMKRDDGDITASLLEMFSYFTSLTAARREHPTEDLISTIANATINGEPLSDLETVSYYLIIATAGHDTTSATIAGGLNALIENPDQLQRLQQDLTLMPSAAEEMIRWVTPVKHFMRTATEDAVIRGVPIRAGESVLLSYPSGNRDEDVFDAPFRFDVGRDPNKHVAFGYGVHFCLGAALARLELQSFFTELLSRLRSIELTSEPERTAGNFVVGIKHLPVRYSLAPA